MQYLIKMLNLIKSTFSNFLNKKWGYIMAQANVFRIQNNERNIRKLMQDDMNLNLRLTQDEAQINANEQAIRNVQAGEEATDELLMRRINRIENNVENDKVANELANIDLENKIELLWVAIDHLRDQTMGQPQPCGCDE